MSGGVPQPPAARELAAAVLYHQRVTGSPADGFAAADAVLAELQTAGWRLLPPAWAHGAVEGGEASGAHPHPTGGRGAAGTGGR